MRTITSPLNATTYYIFWNSFPVVSPSNIGEPIDYRCRPITGITAHFGGFIIPGKNMMVIMPTFAYRQQGHDSIFCRLDWPSIQSISILIQYLWYHLNYDSILIVWAIAHARCMGNTIDHPGNVEWQDITKDKGNEKTCPSRLIP